MNTARDPIFARIREALRHPARPPHVHGGERAAGHAVSEFLPSVGPSPADRLELFRANAADLRADFRLLDNPSQFGPELQRLAAAEGWKKVATHPGTLTTAACPAIGLPVLDASQKFSPGELESCDAGITECDALVAQTGSVLVTATSAGGRALSVLPPHHVVLVRRDQLLPDLPAAFALLHAKYKTGFPSFISLITGPSRTGDIERILVLGAHGPKKLTLLCA